MCGAMASSCKFKNVATVKMENLLNLIKAHAVYYTHREVVAVCVRGV